uniref:D-aminoacyl-tRNA deacylase n=1 Tax=Neogobius melanostomus TaxID=47308 RepID=A0A8C6SIC7_9GOBI
MSCQREKRLKKRPTNEAPVAGVRPLEARVVVQQCSRAKVKTRDGVDGAEPQYAEIGEGLVVFVCFFDGATEDTAHRIANAVMNTQFFHGCLSRSRRPTSVLELPGGVLLLPLQSQVSGQARRGSQLFSSLASHCREMLSKSRATGGAVEQGVYGQRQQVKIEPMSHVLEF